MGSDRPVFHYELKSMICHLGESANTGHYTSIVKHGENWLHFDDGRPVREYRSLKTVSAYTEKSAYILSYRLLN